MSANVEVTRNVEMEAAALFAEILKSGVFPPECTALAMDETGLAGHSPILRRALEMFGTRPNASYTTEYKGVHLPEASRQPITQKYHEFIEWGRKKGATKELLAASYPLGPDFPLSAAEPTYSMRLHMLVIAHASAAGGWSEKAQKAMHVMAKIYGPSLKYQYDVSRTDQPGDFHPLVGWMFQHADELDHLYTEKTDIPHVAAKIAKGVRVIPNMGEINRVIQVWAQRDGDINVDAARVSKAKNTDAAKAPRFPRPGETSITRDFRELFVDLDPRDLTAVKAVLGEPDLSDEDAATYADNLKKLQIFLLTTLSESTVQGRTGILKELRTAVGTGTDLAMVMDSVRQLAVGDETSRSQHLESFDLHLKMKVRESLDAIVKTMNTSPYPGFGAGRALLVHHTSMHVKNNPAAQQLEKLMYYMVEMAQGKRDNFLLSPEN